MTPLQLLDTLEAHRAAHQSRDNEPPVLAFDGDGTLWSGDVGEDAFEHFVAQSLFKDCAHAPLNALCRDEGIREGSSASQAASHLLAAFREQRLGELTACEMMTWAYMGWEPKALHETLVPLLRERELVHRLFAPLQQVLKWTEQNGLRSLVISASPKFVIDAALDVVGAHPSNVAAGQLLLRADPDSGRQILDRHFEYPLPYAEQKVASIERLAPGAPVLAAFGDNIFDFEMLSRANVPVAVRPKTALENALHRLPACVRLT